MTSDYINDPLPRRVAASDVIGRYYNICDKCRKRYEVPPPSCRNSTSCPYCGYSKSLEDFISSIDKDKLKQNIKEAQEAAQETKDRFKDAKTPEPSLRDKMWVLRKISRFIEETDNKYELMSELASYLKMPPNVVAKSGGQSIIDLLDIVFVAKCDLVDDWNSRIGD